MTTPTDTNNGRIRIWTREYTLPENGDQGGWVEGSDRFAEIDNADADADDSAVLRCLIEALGLDPAEID